MALAMSTRSLYPGFDFDTSQLSISGKAPTMPTGSAIDDVASMERELLEKSQASKPPQDPSISSCDSGYGSIGPEEPSTTEPTAPGPAANSMATPHPTPLQQRTFNGLVIFDPSQAQIHRYNELLAHITQPLNSCLQKRRTLKPKSRTKGVVAVRHILMGASQDVAKPHMVFFCARGMERYITDFLEKPAYQQMLNGDGGDETAFAYKVIPDGIRLRLQDSGYSAEIPGQGQLKYDGETNNVASQCGTPIRLCRDGTAEWRRVTLGGVLKIGNEAGDLEYYAMTAGHFLDGWDDTDDEYTIESENDEGQFDDSTMPELSIRATHERIPPWDFEPSKKYRGLFTANTDQKDATNPFYYDWALFKLDEWRENTVQRHGAAAQTNVKLPASWSGTHEGNMPVAIISASSGVIDGVLASEMAQIAIDPGCETIDAYLVSVRNQGKLYTRETCFRTDDWVPTLDISDGDSGSWVVDGRTNTLLGHVVASDILGDIYVIPILDTLGDIRGHLQASFVLMPSSKDAHSGLEVEEANDLAAPITGQIEGSEDDDASVSLPSSTSSSGDFSMPRSIFPSQFEPSVQRLESDLEPFRRLMNSNVPFQRLFSDFNEFQHPHKADESLQERLDERQSLSDLSPGQEMSLIKLESVRMMTEILYNFTQMGSSQDFADVAAGLTNLRKAISHLCLEVRDPDSIVNDRQGDRAYHSRLRAIVSASCSDMEEVSALIRSAGHETGLGSGEDQAKDETNTRKRDILTKAEAAILASKMRIDVFLDTVQLHNPLKQVKTASSADDQGMELIKDKVDLAALRLVSRHDKRIEPENGDLWQQFCAELVSQGFSEDILHSNKVCI